MTVDEHDARQRLAARRTAALARIDALGGDVAAIIDAASSTTGDDEHDPEGATIGFERAQALALVGQAHAQLEAIDAAVRRLDAGTYGRCIDCGQPVGDARLAARPDAARCVTCASRRR